MRWDPPGGGTSVSMGPRGGAVPVPGGGGAHPRTLQIPMGSEGANPRSLRACEFDLWFPVRVRAISGRIGNGVFVFSYARGIVLDFRGRPCVCFSYALLFFSQAPVHQLVFFKPTFFQTRVRTNLAPTPGRETTDQIRVP